MLILKGRKSRLGGVFKDTTKVVKVPHKLTAEDAEILEEFFSLIALQRFIDHFG